MDHLKTQESIHFTGYMASKDQIRFLLFADTHLGFDYPMNPRVQKRRRGQDFFENFKRVLSHAARTKLDFVVHGGDLFFRSRVPAKIVDLAYQMLQDFADQGIPIFIVPGNHERSKLPASLFLNHPNIYIFDRPRTFILRIAGIRIALSGFPSQRNAIRTHFKSILNHTGWRETPAEIRLLCFHQAVEGAQVGTQNFTFRNGRDVIQRSDLPPDFATILAGHIHRHQILKKKTSDGQMQPPVIYPGSTERTSFAEKMEEKGFCEIGLQRTAQGLWGVQEINFIPLPTRPMVDLFLDAEISQDRLEGFLRAQISLFQQDAIVRLRSRQKPDANLQLCLNTQFLQRIFPATMNFQLGSEFFQNTRRP